MGTIEKIALGLIAIGMATTLLLPDRQTERVARAFGDVFTGGLRQAMGQAR
jgi:hypothetical protein